MWYLGLIEEQKENQGTSVLKRSLGKYLNIMEVLQIILFQITNKTNLTLPNQYVIPFPNPGGGHQRPPSAALKLYFS